MPAPISLESKRIMVTALAPMAAAFCTMRSIACRRESSLSLTYERISPPARLLRRAAMLPPMPRDRTVRPKTWPRVCTTSPSGMFSVVVTIIDREGATLPVGACVGFSVGACMGWPPAFPAPVWRYHSDITFSVMLPTGYRWAAELAESARGREPAIRCARWLEAPQPAAGPDQTAEPGQVSRSNPQRARLNQDVADRRRLDRPGHHGQPAGVGGELAQQLVPGAAADQVHGVGVPAR